MSRALLAAIQMVSSNCIEDNLNTVERLVTDAANDGAKIVVLPETFAVFSSREQQALGQREASERAVVRPFIRELAKNLGVWIVAGTVPLAVERQAASHSSAKDEAKVFSSCFVVDSEGKEIARYDKIHLFDVNVADQQGSYRESDTFNAGSDVVVIDTPLGRLGLAVCYDIRFPEFFRAMFALGVDIIAVPAAFTYKTGTAHWLPLLRARAIENQCYIIGANQGGEHSRSRSTSGGSVIIDGWGTVKAELALGEGVAIAEMDLPALQKQRDAMPIAAHQRFDVSNITDHSV